MLDLIIKNGQCYINGKLEDIDIAVKDGKISNVCSSFATYIGELNKSINVVKNNHACSSATIIQLQDIQGWAEGLPKEHKKNADATVKKCKQYITLIKGE